MQRKNIRNTFLRYVSLNVMGMIGLSCYILADTFFIARGIGADGLTSLNLAIPVYSLIYGTGTMIGMGGATRFSLSKSRGIFMQSIYFTILAAFAFLLAAAFSQDISYILGADIETFEDTNIYLKTILCFSPMFLLNNCIICFVRNDKNPRLAMIAMLAGSFSNIILDYVFIFPLGLGMFGAAAATGIAPVISLIILSTHFLRRKNTFHLSKERIKVKMFGDIAALGVSSLITELSSGVVIIIYNFILLGLVGNIGVAAYGIIANIALVVISVFTGISQGIQPIVSDFCQKSDSESAHKIFKYGIITAVAMAAAIYLLLCIYAYPVVEIFNKDKDIRLTAMAVSGFYIYFTSFIFAGINIIFAAYQSAVDNPKKAFTISILRSFVLVVPMAFILSKLLGISGVWLSAPVTEAAVLFISLIMLSGNKSKLTK